MKDEKWEVPNRKALRRTWMCVYFSVAINISKEKTMEGVMSALAKLCENPWLTTMYF